MGTESFEAAASRVAVMAVCGDETNGLASGQQYEHPAKAGVLASFTVADRVPTCQGYGA